MRRDSPVYVKFLENVVEALLEDRLRSGLSELRDLVPGRNLDGSPALFSPYNVRQAIKDASTQPETDMPVTLTPAHGRDYKSKKAIEEDLAANKDFILNDMSSQWDGKPCSPVDLYKEGHRTVNVRYAQLRKIVTCKLPAPKVGG